jgi:HSP20 family protein
MTTTLRDPFLADPFRLMDDLFGRPRGNGRRVTGFVPNMDVHETDDEYVVLVDLPGVKPEDVNVELHEGRLSIAGSRVPAEGGRVQRIERPYGSFVRSLTVPKNVDADAITAEHDLGVLTLRIPKPVEAKPKRIPLGTRTQQAIEQ